MDHQVCSKCGFDKPFSDYFNNKIKKNGKDSSCKKCRGAAHSRWIEENHDSHNQKLRNKYAKKIIENEDWHDKLKKRSLRNRKKYYINNKEKILSYLSEYRIINSELLLGKRKTRRIGILDKVFTILGDKCVLCGENKRELLTVDHIFNDGNIERKKKNSFSIKVNIANGYTDLSRYQILCRNCNSKKFVENPISLMRPRIETGVLKRCSSCGLDKDESYFDLWKFLLNEDQLFYYECTSCRRNKRKEIRDKCFLLLGGECHDCSEQDFDKLSLDHIKDDGQYRRYLFNEPTGSSLCSRIISNEICKDDFQLLCHNCNYLKKAERKCEQIKKFDFRNILVIQSVDKSKNFLNAHHYAGFGRPAVISYLATLDGETIGECKFSSVVRLEVATSLGYDHSFILELDRFCIKPGFHRKNFGSWFISRCITNIRSDLPKISCLVSFADPVFGHTGGLYRASNWKFEHETKPSYYYVSDDDKINKKVLYSAARKRGMKEREYAEFIGVRKVKTPPKYKYVYVLKTQS